jgi:phospholipid/cholesterol/gamma-HCH transport system permease protein
VFRELGKMLLLFGVTLRALPRIFRYRRNLAEQLFEIGNASLFMACVLSLFIGGVLALQAGPLLTQRGLGSMLGGLVGASLAKELGPVMMSILIAGRIGSAMAAELGSMRVYQEIDALRTLNIDPVEYLVLPRVVAISLALPCLLVFSLLIGSAGGAFVAALFNSLKATLEPRDIIHGLIKTFLFAVTVGVVCCNQGLDTLGGPRGIGRSVTKAVVNSIVFILVLDYIITRMLLPFTKNSMAGGF